MENLRHLLYQHRPETSVFIGHRQIYKRTKLFEGYMSGALMEVQTKPFENYYFNLIEL